MGKSSSSKRKRSNASSSVSSSPRRLGPGRVQEVKVGLSSSSDSYSSSGDNHRSRRSRSSSPKDCKSRTRVHRDSYLYSSDEGATPPKKRKDSKRKGDSWTRRKSVRKRYRRDWSVSSASCPSLSCSTCANRSSSEDVYEHYRRRSERRESRVDLENRQRRDRSCSRV